MIIKIIPETDAERARISEVEHTNVKEFFMFGSKKDSDKDMIDFHDWSGQYRYLITNLLYLLDKIKDEEQNGTIKKSEINLPSPKMIKYGNSEVAKDTADVIKRELGNEKALEDSPVLEFITTIEDSEKGTTANMGGDVFPITETEKEEKQTVKEK